MANLGFGLNLTLGPFLVAFLVTFLVTPAVIALAERFGLVDDPRLRRHPARIHQGVIPRAGGLAILAGLLAASLTFLPLDQHVLGILAGSILVVLVGVADDKFDLNPYFRLLTNFLAAGLVVASGIGIAFLTNPFGGIIDLSHPRIYFQALGEIRSLWITSDLFALFWIVWLMNMVNWSKGVGGQMPGFVAIAAVTIGFLSLRFTEDVTQWPVVILAFISAGAYLGFLPWNFPPQKIMPGYGGGSLAGYLLAILSILSGAKVATGILVLGLPMIDALVTVVRRLIQGRSPVWADRGHLHHRLLDLGFSERQVAIFYWVAAALLGAVALNLNSQQKFYTIVMLGIILGGIILWLNLSPYLSEPPDRPTGSKT